MTVITLLIYSLLFVFDPFHSCLYVMLMYVNYTYNQKSCKWIDSLSEVKDKNLTRLLFVCDFLFIFSFLNIKPAVAIYTHIQTHLCIQTHTHTTQTNTLSLRRNMKFCCWQSYLCVVWDVTVILIKFWIFISEYYDIFDVRYSEEGVTFYVQSA